MANNAREVSTAKPSVKGAVFRAPTSAEMPTSANVPLSADFVHLGYISDAGVKMAIERSSEEIKAWGGTVVATPQTEYKEKFTMAFLQALNVGVLKAVYVDSNVEGDLDNGITIKGNSKEHEEYCWVVDTVLNGNVNSRTVIPYGKVSEVGEVEYVDGTPITHEVTIAALPDDEGNCHYEYIEKNAEAVEEEPSGE